MISLYSSGKSTRDISKVFIVSSGTIATVLKSCGVEMNGARSMSVKMKGRQSPRKGAILSDATRKKISINNLGKRTSLGQKRTEESKRKMSESRKRYFTNNPAARDNTRDAFRFWKERGVTNSDGQIIKNSLTAEERIKRNRIRGRCKNILRRLINLKVYVKKGATQSILGYTYMEYREHIESQFQTGMSWDKRDSFEVDHIIPVKAFLDHGINDPAIINALCNLSPLPKIKNIQKSGNYNKNSFPKNLFDIISEANAMRIDKGRSPIYEFV